MPCSPSATLCHILCVHVQARRALGDSWLEPSGKKRVQGEQGTDHQSSISTPCSLARHGCAAVNEAVEEAIRMLGTAASSHTPTCRRPMAGEVNPPFCHSTGPEELRGRKSLFELMQWKPINEPAGEAAPARAPVGDAWLDSKGKKRVPLPGGRA